MGYFRVVIKLTVLLVSFGNLSKFTQSVDYSDPIWSTHDEKRHQAALDMLASEVIHHPDRRSSLVEGSGQNVESTLHIFGTAILKRMDLQLQDGHATKHLVNGRSGKAPLLMASEKTSVAGGQKTLGDFINTGGNIPGLPVKTNNHSVSTPAETLLFGVRSCPFLTNFNGTSLDWDDMKRTLSFAWELHVFGSASLFILLGLLGVFGVVCACTLPHPLCEALVLANSLLVISVTLRAVLLLLDPYGTRQVLSRASLAALHNISLHLFLWSQISLAVVTLRGLSQLFFQLQIQNLWVVAVLALSHCIPLLVADLYSSAVSTALPLLLHTLSFCWGVPLGMGIITKSLSNLANIFRSSATQWMPSRRIERRAKRVTAACAILGILSSSLHMYSLLWLYGLLGNWRHFGWGWWLCQFWARILELFWGFSLVLLGSWVFWTSSRGHSRGKHSQSRGDTNLFNKIPSYFRRGPLRKSEKTWEELMPNNWAKYKLSRAGISKARTTYDEQSDHTDPISTTSCESQAAVLWQKVGDRECVLSLIELDMTAPSPINLRHSINNALHHGQLMSGSLFIAPPPSLTHTLTGNTDEDDMFPPAYSIFDWAMDAESIPASLLHFETIEFPGFISDQSTKPTIDELNLEFLSGISQDDLSEDDITDM